MWNRFSVSLWSADVRPRALMTPTGEQRPGSSRDPRARGGFRQAFAEVASVVKAAAILAIVAVFSIFS